MSFFVLFNSDRAAVDLDRLKGANPQIVPQNVQILGRECHVAFVASRPTWAGSAEDATCSDAIDERFWLVGRIRLDGREEIRSTISIPRAVEPQSDASFFLRAYARWGDRCLDYLRGDFCFVLWDEDRQRLFCGRDQLGVRPLFYATHRNRWIVGDSLANVAAVSAIKGDLDHFWVADFLSFGDSADSDRTIYKQVKRLPAAHFLSICDGGSVVRKYWTLESREPIYYHHARDYVEHFHEVVGLAVKDRLPQDRVGISMSGGLDSSTLAAHVLMAVKEPSKIVAHTRHFEHLIPDAEAHFSSLVTNKLGIPLSLRAIDDACYDPNWHDRELSMPEPNSAAISAIPRRIIADEMAEQAKVWFYGEGPDNALVFEWQSYLQWLFKKMDWFRLSAAVVQYLRGKHAREWSSTVGTYIRRYTVGDRKLSLELPQWLDEGFVTEHQLNVRARQLRQSSNKKHPWHPKAIAGFTTPRWHHFLEQFDPSISGSPIAWRHPYLDLRVLTFLLAVPPIPWARRKLLIREAMRDWLPKEVLYREKAPLSGDPLAKMLQRYGLPQLSSDGQILYYIDPTKVPKTLPDELLLRPLIRVYVLDAWLKSNARKFSRGTAQ
jgi:asparagine synthase (glutamine-hydrolysing)